MARSTIYQTYQLGLESVPGTLVPANKKLTSIGFEFSPNPDIQTYRPAGNKYDTLANLNREWTEIDITGGLTYTEIVYLLSGSYMKPTPVTATGVTTWTFTPASAAPDSVATYTIERGDGTFNERVGYVLITELGMSFSREACEASGAAIGTQLEKGVSLTSSPTSIALVPILGTQVAVYLEDSAAALAGATALSTPLAVDFKLGNRFGPAWYLNANNTYQSHVELEPDLEVNLTLEANTAGMALFDDMRVGATKFMRIEATGPQIGATGVNYLMQLDFALKVKDIGDFSDNDGVMGIEYNFTGVHDATWGRALNAVVKNDVTGL